MSNGPLPLAPGARPCIGCGYACRKGPCPFGTWDAVRHQCIHLTSENKCAIYDQIIARPVEEWAMSPAFGSGCSSPMNSDRQRLLKERAGNFNKGSSN